LRIIIILVIAVSLSMDAFSLSTAYGTLNPSKKEVKQISIIVGFFHFFMPLIGLFLGKIIFGIIPIPPDFIVFLVLVFIGIQMILESKKEENIKKMKFTEFFLFAFAVSVDSFSVGVGLNAISNHYLFCSIIFSLSSFIFTYLGLSFGRKLNKKFGKKSTKVGGITLLLLGLMFLF
jgi:Predicted membrane protein